MRPLELFIEWHSILCQEGPSMSRVLVVGKAPEVIDRLVKRGHEVVLWPQDKKRQAPTKHKIFQAPDESTSEEIKALWELQFPDKKPGYVLACSERSVLPAARARAAFRVALNSYKVVERFRNKKVMKEFLNKISTPMTPFIFCKKQTKLEDLIETLGLPLVLKEAQTSGSRGLLISSDFEELKHFSLEGKIAEKFIHSPEFSVESFIHHGEIVFTNITQYYRKASINIVPSIKEEKRQERLLKMNQEVLKSMGVKQGMTHLEVYDNGDDLLFGEVALRPPGGYIMELLSSAYQIDAWDAYVAIELEEYFEFPKAAKHFCASYIYHPGEGVVKEVLGFDEMKTHPACSFAKCKLRPGKQVKKREGLGQNGGHFIFQHKDHQELLLALDQLDKKFQIVMEPLA